MKKFVSNPWYILGWYIAIIFIFSFIYMCAPDKTFASELGFLKSIYFSVITITTLGYGEITPLNDYGMIFTSLEAIIGILIIGIFINSAWKNFSDKIEKEQAKQLQLSIYKSNKNNLSAYYSYLSSVLTEYKRITFELTTPMSLRQEKKDFSYKFKFKFSDLQDMLHQSLFLKHGFSKSVIEIYSDTENELIMELKYLLANFGLEDFPDLKHNIIEFLNIVYSSNVNDILISYSKYPKDSPLRKTLDELIKKFDELPPTEYHQGNTLSPVIILFKTIPIKMSILTAIENDLKSISEEK